MILIAFLCFPFIYHSWDGEDVEYDFEIAKDPIPNRDLSEENEFYMWNKFEQRFICFYPYYKKSSLRKKSESEDSNKLVDDIAKSLDHIKLCVHLETGGWWTYRICFHDKITQFHSQDGKTVAEYSLGKYEGDKKWTLGELEAETNVTRFHEQYYVGGTACELNNNPRHTTVKYYCDPNHSFKVNALREVASCAYEIVIETNILCKFPAFLPVFNAAKLKVTCAPTLSEDEIVLYHQKQKEKAKMHVPVKSNSQSNFGIEDVIPEDAVKTVLLKIGGKEYKVNLVSDNVKELFAEEVGDSSRSRQSPSSSTSDNKDTKQASKQQDQSHNFPNTAKNPSESDKTHSVPSENKPKTDSDEGGKDSSAKDSEGSDSFGSWIWNSLREVARSPFEEQMKNYQFSLYDSEEDSEDDSTRTSGESSNTPDSKERENVDDKDNTSD